LVVSGTRSLLFKTVPLALTTRNGHAVTLSLRRDGFHICETVRVTARNSTRG